MGTLAVIYTRYSTDRQDPRSIGDQNRTCEEYARDEGLSVVARFADEALSGTRDDRPGLERLLRRAKQLPFHHLLIDDSSRLSRDDIDAKTLVFRTLRALGIVVHEVSSGLRSDDENAELLWGVKGLIDAQYIRDLRKKTHRGLKGRALEGFCTGGRTYGYANVPEPDPPDPEHPRAVQQVDDDEAKIVRRIFREYADGAALSHIASSLNVKGVPAPYDGPSHDKPAGRGWSAVQVWSMLRNQRYVGRVVWNKREWAKDPVTKRRRPRLRPEKDWVIRDSPDLRIVPQELWEAVQARHGSARRGVPLNGKAKKRLYLFSGLLRCGLCGAGMSVVGARRKTNSRGETQRWVSFGCSAHHGKGDAVCPNKKTIGERQVTESVLRGLVDYVQGPNFKAWVEEATAAAERARKKTTDSDEDRLAAAVRTQAARVARAAERFVDSDGSEAVKVILAREEAKLRDLRRELAALSTTPAPRPVDLRLAARAFEDIGALVAVDPQAARARLCRYLEPVVLTPVQDEETGEIVYNFDISLKLDSVALVGGDRGLGLHGCGGLQLVRP